MSAGFNTRIVTNGLIVYLDAANRKSHPKTGNTWYDMSGNGNNCSLLNNPTYINNNLGFVYFNSVSEEFGSVYSLEGGIELGDFTACAWFKRETVGSVPSIDRERILDKNTGSGFWIGRNGTDLNLWGGGVRDNISPYGVFVTLNDGEWHYIVSRRLGDILTISGNGGSVTASKVVSSSLLGNSALRLAVNNRENGAFFHGNIAVVQLYNRALTDEEIKQNFNAHRGRFGK